MTRHTANCRTAASLLACLGLCACDPILILSGQPDVHLARTLSGVDQESDVASACGLPRGVKPGLAYSSSPSMCYWVGKSAIDYQYQAYKTNLLHAVNSGTALGDFAVLALNTAGVITPGATAAKLFNALAAGVTGTKGLINQDILYKQTVTILISEMDTDRTVSASVAEKALHDTASPASQAEIVNDLLAYYEAGTFQHALVAIQNKAGAPSTADVQKTAAPASNPGPGPVPPGAATKAGS